MAIGFTYVWGMGREKEKMDFCACRSVRPAQQQERKKNWKLDLVITGFILENKGMCAV